MNATVYHYKYADINSELIHVSVCVSDNSCVLSGKLCTPPVENRRVNKVLL